MDKLDGSKIATNYITNSAGFKHGYVNQETCEHEWWEDHGVVYTSCPPKYIQYCKLCGASRFVAIVVHTPPRFVKVGG